jgi:hypothetical protein
MGDPDGIYPDLAWDRYRAIERTNISTLKEMARSALHYRHRLEHDKETTALSLGRSAHAAILEPERFARDYTVWDQVTDGGAMSPRRGSKWNEFCAANQGRTIVRPNEHRFAVNIAAAVHNKPVARKYLREGKAELSMLWTDVETKRPCKGRIDWVTHVDGIDCVVGLKTARDLSPRTFSSQAARLLYYQQWAFYLDGHSTLTKKEPRMVEICVEVEPPHDVVVYIVPIDVLELGREEYRALLVKLGECERSKRWPGRADNEVMFELPAYMQHDDDEELDDLGLEGDPAGKGITICEDL